MLGLEHEKALGLGANGDFHWCVLSEEDRPSKAYAVSRMVDSGYNPRIMQLVLRGRSFCLPHLPVTAHGDGDLRECQLHALIDTPDRLHVVVVELRTHQNGAR